MGQGVRPARRVLLPLRPGLHGDGRLVLARRQRRRERHGPLRGRLPRVQEGRGPVEAGDARRGHAVDPGLGGAGIELGAAFVIIYGTGQGWPLSTTHCQIGATVAVGLFEGRKGVNAWLFAKCCFGWVITLVVVGTTTALLVGPSPEPLKGEY